jgi:hypothetical protein
MFNPDEMQVLFTVDPFSRAFLQSFHIYYACADRYIRQELWRLER